jgi:molecular chaperone Hsp33
MSASDCLQAFVFEHGGVRGATVSLGATWRAVLERRDYPEPLRGVLGELMAAAALLASNLKFEGSMIMQMQGGGPVTLLVVECTSELTLRAMAHWQAEPAGPLLRLFGDGRFVITLDPVSGTKKYQSQILLDGDSVARVLEHYMHRSEQLDTRFWLAADGTESRGMLLQKMPREGTDPDLWNRTVTLASTLTGPELLAVPGEALIRRLFHDEDVRVFSPRPVAFRCSCSRERVIAMLRMLGPAEVGQVVESHGEVEVNCEFCNRRYAFDRVDAEQLFAAQVVTRPDGTHH